MKTATATRFVNHYNHASMNALGIVMCDRFERRLESFVELAIRNIDIKKMRLTCMIYSSPSRDANLRDGVLVTVAIKYGRMKTSSVDVRVTFDVDENGQQTFNYVLDHLYI